MADDNENGNERAPKDGKTLLAKVRNKINGAAYKVLEQKIEGLVKTQIEHQTAVRQIDDQINQLVADYEASLKE